MRPVIYLTGENPVVARDLACALIKNVCEVVLLAAPIVAASLQGHHGGVVLANVDRGGLDFAREIRSIRSDAGVVYTASAPQRVRETARVRGEPVMRSPITPR